MNTRDRLIGFFFLHFDEIGSIIFPINHSLITVESCILKVERVNEFVIESKVIVSDEYS